MSIIDICKQLDEEIKVLLEREQSAENKSAYLKTLEASLVDKAGKIAKKEKSIEQSMENSEQEKLFISRKMVELDKKEEIMNKLVEKGANLKKEESLLEEKTKTLRKLEFDLKEFQESLKDEKEELVRREALVEKQILIDKERKYSLEIESQANKQERERLQRLAMQYNPQK